MRHPDHREKDAALALPSWVMRMSLWLGRIGGGLVFLMAFPITIDVITRKLFSVSLLESYEISTYAFAVAVAFGYTYALLAGAHIRIDVMYARLKQGPRAILDVVALCLLSGVSAILAWQAAITAIESFRIGARSNSSLGAPLALPQLMWAAGLVLFAVMSGIVLVRVAWLVARRRYQMKEHLLGGAAMAAFETGTARARPGGAVEDRDGEAR
ncbi:MAG: TRAP transporter small permease subunit [Alphaproteobacteria bacterium]|nr:TRAP transporter small permease subunit [Alphaproteobacteria bacterium]